MLTNIAGNQTKRFRFAYEAKTFLGVKYSVFKWALESNTPINGWTIRRLVSLIPEKTVPISLSDNAPRSIPCKAKASTKNPYLAAINNFQMRMPAQTSLLGYMVRVHILNSGEFWLIRKKDFNEYAIVHDFAKNNPSYFEQTNAPSMHKVGRDIYEWARGFYK